MNCEFIHQNINDVCHSNLTELEQQQVNAHLTNCPDCQQMLSQHQAYLAKLANLQTPELTAENKQRLINQAQIIKTATNRNNGFVKGFAAASVLFLSIFLFNQQQVDPVVAPIAKNINLVPFTTQVSLIIYVPEDMPNADLQLQIPDEIELVGYEGLASLSWPVDLKQGANVLQLPIEVPEGIDLNQAIQFIANINNNNTQKDFALEVKLVSPQQGAADSVFNLTNPTANNFNNLG
ncbi:anti-sigma factor family protein [Catenovulum sp. SX2]|uniref:anti-sigma factor family protein n=1 Tax=Catenovulum sp. SX2 TaxID=3398614 RepID=UPI003F875F57